MRIPLQMIIISSTIARMFSIMNNLLTKDYLALYVFVSNTNIIDDTIIRLLYEAGTHLDCVNALKEAPISIASNLNIKQFLKTRAKLSLKCLCAKLIQKNNISFHGKIAASLIKFVEKHYRS